MEGLQASSVWDCVLDVLAPPVSPEQIEDNMFFYAEGQPQASLGYKEHRMSVCVNLARSDAN